MDMIELAWRAAANFLDVGAAPTRRR